MKIGYLIVTVILIVVLIASPVYLQLGNNQLKTIGGSRTYWKALATNAWNYFQPGKGVDATTGLHGAGIGYPYFTDWDLGVYIQAIIDAERLGILSKDGAWGADARLEKILLFLENRQLTSDGLPYVRYDSRTGGRYIDSPANAWDTGKLLVALRNLKLERPDLATRIDSLVYDKVNYEPLREVVDTWTSFADIYYYYAAKGFAGFWSERFSSVAETILNKIVSAATVETYGVNLPGSTIACDPLLHSVFELKPDSRLQELAKQVYLAHEARYNATGKYAAFSEGNTGLFGASYVYEWVMFYGRPWVIHDTAYSDVQITPIIYFKVAVGFLAIYNTEFTRNMVGYLEANIPQPTSGYIDGIDENGRLVSTTIDKTNGLIISAARYVIEHNDFSAVPWQNGDLSVFPRPFIRDGVINNTAVVIGESKPRGPVGSAQTIDTIGAMLITERLARESVNGTLKAAIDSWVVKYGDSGSENVTMLDNSTNLIIVGSPETNVLSYYYNSLRDTFGEPLVPVLFVVNSAEGYNYLYVPTSGLIYKMEFDEQGKLVADYGVIMAFQDQFGRYAVVVYGLSANGTLGACQVLRDYDIWSLHGSAVIVKSYVDTLGRYPSNSSIADVVTLK